MDSEDEYGDPSNFLGPSRHWVEVQVKANDARAASTNHRVLAEPPEKLSSVFFYRVSNLWETE